MQCFAFQLCFFQHTLPSNPPSLSNQYFESPASFEPTSDSLTKPRRNKRTFRSLLFHVNGPGTRCSLFSRIFSTFPETTLLAGPAGGHPPGCPHRAGLISLSKKKSVCGEITPEMLKFKKMKRSNAAKECLHSVKNLYSLTKPQRYSEIRPY